jgi:hypothetical protein
MTVSLEEKFRADFPEVVALVDEIGGHHLEFTLPIDAIGVGESCTLIIKHTPSSRGFGMTWRMAQRRLDGMRSRSYSADAPDSEASREWLAEMRRRLAVGGGATQGEIVGRAGGGYHPRHRARWRHELATRAY